MSIVMVMKWEGVTPEQYETVRNSVNWEGNPPKGGVFHISGFDGTSLRVTDIWESPEEFNAFVQDRLTPGTIAAGIQGEPHVDIFPLHATFLPQVEAVLRHSRLTAAY